MTVQSPAATITEADVEAAALAWLEGVGWGVAHRGGRRAGGRTGRSARTTGARRWSGGCGTRWGR